MAWMPGATKRELSPESEAQPAIRPTQLIMHSIAAPWSGERIYEYWRDSTNLESHFGGAYDGGLFQFIGTQTRADANASANRRADGTGAVSIETASDLQHTDPWTDAQIDALIRLGVWMHRTHGIPLRICRTWDDPGFGYHGLFPQWSVSGTACPGAARIAQFKSRVMPGIIRAAQGGTPPTQEDDMPEPIDLWAYRNADAEKAARKLGKRSPDAYAYLVGGYNQLGTVNTKLDALAAKVTAPTPVTVDAAKVAAALIADGGFVTRLADAVAKNVAKRLEA